MFTAALFLIAKTWNQSRCLLVGEWISWSRQTMEYYSLLKINKLSSLKKTREKLKMPISKLKKPSKKGHILTIGFQLYDSWRRQHYGVSKNTSTCQLLGGTKEMNRRTQHF